MIATITTSPLCIYTTRLPLKKKKKEGIDKKVSLMFFISRLTRQYLLKKYFSMTKHITYIEEKSDFIEVITIDPEHCNTEELHNSSSQPFAMTT